MRELSIAFGNSCMAKKWSNKLVSWEALTDILENTVRTPESVEEYQKMKRSEKEAAKDKGGFVGGQLRDGRRKREAVVSRSMLTLDIDHASVGFIDQYEMLCSFSSALYTTHGHTPEAPRIRLVVPLTRDVTPDEYQAIARYYAAEWGIDQFDECSYRPHQLMYWPTTPSNGEYVYRQVTGKWLDPDMFLAAHPLWRDCSLLPTSKRESEVKKYDGKKAEDPLKKEGIVGVFCRCYGIQDVMECFLSDVYEPSEAIPGRYQYKEADSAAGVQIYDDKFSYSHHASDPACGMLLNAFDLVRVHRFPDDDEKKSFQAMAEFAAGDDRVKLQSISEKQKTAAEEFDGEDPDEWKKQLEYEKKSMALKNTLHNITLIMENDAFLKGIVFNQLADGMEIKGEVPWKHPEKFWRDADDAQLICYVDENYGSFSARNYDIAVTKVVDDRSYHPIREYFSSLPEWDGVKRVDTLLIDYLGAADTPYVRAITRKLLCAAYMRVHFPGIKFDTMLVLNGDQGIGKSTGLYRIRVRRRKNIKIIKVCKKR